MRCEVGPLPVTPAQESGLRSGASLSRSVEGSLQLLQELIQAHGVVSLVLLLHLDIVDLGLDQPQGVQ